MGKNNNIVEIGKNWASTRFKKMPTQENWYQTRLEICTGCEYNSENIPQEKKTEAHLMRDKLSGIECQGKRHCTACGCCINQKASIKTSVCGLTELNLEPKWFALEIDNDDKQYYSVTNLTPDNCHLIYNDTKGNEHFIFDFGLTDKKVLNLEFKIFSPQKCQFVTMERDVSGFPLIALQEKDHLLVRAQIPTQGLKEGITNEFEFSYTFLQTKGENKARFVVKTTKQNTNEL